MSERLAIHGGDPMLQRDELPAWPVFGEAEERSLLRVLRSGKWGRLDGAQVAAFEKRFAAYCGSKHAVAVNNGSVSLQIALMAAGIQAGDEVIVPPYTFLATATAVVLANAVPVFVDVELDTFNLDVEQVEAAITPRTRAVIPVHFAGQPVEMDALMDIARRHGLTVIEDAAHAHGSEYKGRRAGSIGHLGSFSFQSSKNLTSGEGGLITTSDDALAGGCASIHNCGRLPGHKWYEHFMISCNYRMSELQGGLLNAQMDRLDDQIRTREANARYLAEQLSTIPGLSVQRRTSETTRHAYHLFMFRLDPRVLGVSKHAFVAAVEAEGVPLCTGYASPLYRQPLFENLAFGPFTGYKLSRPDLDYRRVSCPNCELLCAEQAGWIEHRALLGTREHMDKIGRAFIKVHEHRHSLKEPPARA